MKKIRWMFPVILCLIVLSFLSSCMSGEKPDPTLLFEARRVYSLDYDPDSQTLYFIWSEERVGIQDHSQFITSRHLPSGQETVVASDFPFLFRPWIAVGKDGEVYVLDNGKNFTHDPNKDPNVRSLLVYEDHTLSQTYLIEYLTDENPNPLLEKDARITYLGMERTENNVFYPKFIFVEKPEGHIQVFDPAYAQISWSDRSLEHYLENNLQNLLVGTFLDTHMQQKEIWVNSDQRFRYREKSSLFLIFGNSPCERVYDLVHFQEKRYNMGQCIRGIHLFPSSGHFFTQDNRLIFVSSGGIYLLES